MFELNTTTALIGVLAIALLLFLFRRRKFNRHKFNRKKADKIIIKLNSFTGEHRQAQVLSYLRKIDPFVFEELLLNAFSNMGYKAIRNKRYTGDGGIDGKLVDKKGKLILVQAKRYKSYISKQHVVQFAVLVENNKKVDRGLFVHTGKTGGGVRELVAGTPGVTIISGGRLVDMIINNN